jgi:hypothetical protein
VAKQLDHDAGMDALDHQQLGCGVPVVAQSEVGDATLPSSRNQATKSVRR